jgi:hypothetical protein
MLIFATVIEINSWASLLKFLASSNYQLWKGKTATLLYCLTSI